MLSGFLAPDGTFTYCEAYKHLDTAQEIVSKITGQWLNRIKAEDYLFEKGYVELTSRGATHRFFIGQGKLRQTVLLTEEQRDFLIKNLSNANKEQTKEIINILQYDEDIREDNILSRMEHKYFA